MTSPGRRSARRRTRGKRWSWLLPVSLGIAAPACLAAPAAAYLDPGTGSYVFQILVAALLGASVAVKIYWRKLKRLLRPSAKSEDDPHPDE